MNSYFGKHLHMSLLLSTQLLHFNPDNFESLFLILGSKERLDLVCKTLILSYSCKDFPDAFCRRSLSAPVCYSILWSGRSSILLWGMRASRNWTLPNTFRFFKRWKQLALCISKLTLHFRTSHRTSLESDSYLVS